MNGLDPHGPLTHGQGGHTLLPPTGGIIVMAVSRLLLYLNIALIKSVDLTPQGPLSHGQGGGAHCIFPNWRHYCYDSFLFVTVS